MRIEYKEILQILVQVKIIYIFLQDVLKGDDNFSTIKDINISVKTKQINFMSFN